MPEPHETALDRLQREWVRSEKDIAAWIAQSEEACRQFRASREQVEAETKALLDRLEGSGGATA